MAPERAMRQAYLDDVWYPLFLRNWIDKGELWAIVFGYKVWSEAADDLVPINPGSMPEETERTWDDWKEYANYAYETKALELGLPVTERKRDK